MVRAARTGGGADSGHKEPNVEPWDVHRAGQIGREQLAAITQLHESFARSLTLALGTYLRVCLPPPWYRPSISPTASLPSASRKPLIWPPANWIHGRPRRPATGSESGFPIIDLLLGGEGKGIAAPRDITEIEDQIVESVARIVCRELGAAWHAIELQVSFEERIELALAQRLMLPNEKILSLSFEVSLLEVRGGLNLAVPVSLSHALLRKISKAWMDSRPRGRPSGGNGCSAGLLQCPFPVELGSTASAPR